MSFLILSLNDFMCSVVGMWDLHTQVLNVFGCVLLWGPTHKCRMYLDMFCCGAPLTNTECIGTCSVAGPTHKYWMNLMFSVAGPYTHKLNVFWCVLLRGPITQILNVLNVLCCGTLQKKKLMCLDVFCCGTPTHKYCCTKKDQVIQTQIERSVN